MKSLHFLLLGLLLVSTASFADVEKKEIKAKDLSKETSISLSKFKIPAGEYEIYLIDGKVYGMKEGSARIYKNLSGPAPFKFCAIQTHCNKSGDICGLKSERVISKVIKPLAITHESTTLQQVTFQFASDEPDFGNITCTFNKTSPDITVEDIENQLGSSVKFTPKSDPRTKNSGTKSSVELVEINKSNFKSEIANGLFVVEVSADGCMPCFNLKAVLVKLAQKYEGCIRFGIYPNGETEGHWVPETTFYRDGVKSGSFLGYKDEGEVDAEIAKFLLRPEDALKCVNKVGQPANNASKQDDQKNVKRVEKPSSNKKKKQDARQVK